MKVAWINDLAGSYGTIENSEIWSKVGTHQLRRLYLDWRRATRHDVDRIHAHGCEAGLYGANNWYDGITGVDFAREGDAVLVRLGLDNVQCAVALNVEQPHSPLYFLACLREWRLHRPGRVTAWHLEGMQSGWFSPLLVATINRDVNLEVVAESFTGSMAPQGEDRVRSNLVVGGIDRRRALVAYDGAELYHPWWDGSAFTLERMPLHLAP